MCVFIRLNKYYISLAFGSSFCISMVYNKAMPKAKAVKKPTVRILLNRIKKNCLDCMCGSSKEVKLCETTKCPLHEFRFGS